MHQDVHQKVHQFVANAQLPPFTNSDPRYPVGMNGGPKWPWSLAVQLSGRREGLTRRPASSCHNLAAVDAATPPRQGMSISQIGSFPLHAKVHRHHKYLKALFQDVLLQYLMDIPLPPEATEEMDHDEGLDV